LDVLATPLAKRELTVLLDTSATTANPLLAQLRQQIVVAQQSRRVEQARLKPDFVLGLSTQTIIGSQLFNGVETYYGPGHRFVSGQIGVSFPLIAKPQKARIEAARLGEQIAQTELVSQQRAIQQQLSQAAAQYEQYRSALTYYEQNGLSQARLILDNARKAFSGGDIGYVEFSLAIQQSLTIRSSYLDLLNQYNQSVLYLEYLLGQP
jgi:cobalt-zinc-cadmium resistance protein CzcA